MLASLHNSIRHIFLQNVIGNNFSGRERNKTQGSLTKPMGSGALKTALTAFERGDLGLGQVCQHTLKLKEFEREACGFRRSESLERFEWMRASL